MARIRLEESINAGVGDRIRTGGLQSHSLSL